MIGFVWLLVLLNIFYCWIMMTFSIKTLFISFIQRQLFNEGKWRLEIKFLWPNSYSIIDHYDCSQDCYDLHQSSFPWGLCAFRSWTSFHHRFNYLHKAQKLFKSWNNWVFFRCDSISSIIAWLSVTPRSKVKYLKSYINSYLKSYQKSYLKI